MKKIIYLYAILAFHLVFSQVSLSGNKLIKDGQTYKISHYRDVFSNEEARRYMKKARTNNTVAYILGFAGGASLGVSIPLMLKKKKEGVIMYGPYGPVYGQVDGPYGYGYAIMGAGLIGAGIPFAIKANKNAKKAIQIENGEATAFKPYFKVETAGNGIALSYNF